MKSVVHLTSVHSRNDIRIFHKQCCSLSANGYNVSLVVADGNGDEIIDNVNTVDVGKIPGRFNRMYKTSRHVFVKALSIQADLYHFHDPELLPVGLLLKLRGKKVVYDAHEDLPRQMLTKHWVHPLLRKPLAWFIEVFEDLVSRQFDAVVTATPHIEARFRNADCNSLAINNYPKLEEFDMLGVARERKEPAVCYVGGITETRGIWEMVAAIGKTNVRLLLAGTFNVSALREDVSAAPGWHSVVEYGFVGRQEVADILSKSMAGLVILHPTANYVVSLPIKMFEYMAAGIPVIASDFPLWREIVVANDCGLCVDPLDPEAIAGAISWLVEHPEEARRMGANGRRAVEERFTWEREGEKLVALYRDLLA